MFKSLKEEPPAYKEFLDRYKGKSPNDKMKSAMTDLAFCMARDVWLDLPAVGRGSCFFCIGGVNAINPFSATAVKNEIVVFADTIKEGLPTEPIPADEGAVYSMDGVRQPELDLTAYDEIYIDFNGSMAFFGEEWQRRLCDPAIARKVQPASKEDHHISAIACLLSRLLQIRGVFVMGGVYADATPMTMPSIPNVLNRFSRH